VCGSDEGLSAVAVLPASLLPGSWLCVSIPEESIDHSMCLSFPCYKNLPKFALNVYFFSKYFRF